MNPFSHGGDIYFNHVNMDFSVNINPLGPPDAVKQVLAQSQELLLRYPDMRCNRLRALLADTLQIDSDDIIFGNGASELLMALAHAYRPRRILVQFPSFAGYRWIADAVNAEVVQIEDALSNEDIRSEDLIIITNPNNPTGEYVNAELLKEALIKCKEVHAKVLIDECFMELSDSPKEHSLLPQYKDYHNLYILRAFTKTFAIPGVRLGYLVSANSEGMKAIRKNLPEWNVSSIAEACGVAAVKAVSDTNYLEDARTLIMEEREYLRLELENMGIKVHPSVTTFLLVESHQPLAEILRENGILIRKCANFEGLGDDFYRIAVRKHEDNEELIRCLKSRL